MLLVPDYREKLEIVFEERIQTPLTIASLEGRMSGLTPQFIAKKIRLPAPEGEVPLELNEVVLSVDVLSSLLHRDLVLHELLINGVELHLVREDSGQIRLRGLGKIGQTQPQSGATETPPITRFLELFYRQKLLSVRNAKLSLDWPGMPPLATSDLTAALVQEGGGHRLAVDFTARDRPLAVQAKFHLHEEVYDVSSLMANAYLRIKGERLEEWLPKTLSLPVGVESLNGRLALWTTIEHGRPQEARLSLSLPRVNFVEHDVVWPVRDLSLRASLARDEQYATLSLSNLSLESPAGPLVLGDMGLRWRIDGEERHWALRTQDLPVRAISQQFQACRDLLI